ncbi:PREDICTED: 39S ribosomal protein L28, mitochondrial [Drosophila arizonae]|uniref:39S ribosomal protein L28, mitochondrial n=1 Tax=Drosophila arizonae TaxID=7263 RepID=A0ABM1NRH3_DROAR|nr:PREDICTED: 39S ribosomal protein L28, mitochondrial [Drosophila arizonae]
MAHATPQGVKLLNGFKRPGRFEKGLGAQLPEAYKKFWREWKLTKPAAVHYIPKESEWERDEVTNAIKPVQSIPFPLIDTPESHQGIWGGEAVIKGFQKRQSTKRRVPHFWVPTLRRSVVHSQVLNEYMSVVVTERTLEQIHECHGFDHYLLKNLACDLRSALALKLKRKILKSLQMGCPALSAEPKHQSEVLKEYSPYLASYTSEEIDWYGHTYLEAIRKLQDQLRAAEKVIPHKVEFRSKLIERLREAGIAEAGKKDPRDSVSHGDHSDADIDALTKLESSTPSSSWLSKINPFGKKET